MNLLLLTETDRTEADHFHLAARDRRAEHLRKVLRAVPGDTFRAGLIGGKIGKVQAVAKLPVSMQVRYDTMPASAKAALRQIGAMGR